MGGAMSTIHIVRTAAALAGENPSGDSDKPNPLEPWDILSFLRESLEKKSKDMV